MIGYETFEYVCVRELIFSEKLLKTFAINFKKRMKPPWQHTPGVHYAFSKVG